MAAFSSVRILLISALEASCLSLMLSISMNLGHVVPDEKVHPDLFKGAGKPFRRIPRARIAAAHHNKVY